jgi:phage terminase large subunit-like protein
MATAQKKRRAKARGVGEGCGAEGVQPLPPLGAAGPHPDSLPPLSRNPSDSAVATGEAELRLGGEGEDVGEMAVASVPASAAAPKKRKRNRKRVDPAEIRLKSLRGGDAPAVAAPAAVAAPKKLRAANIGRPVKAPAETAPVDAGPDRITTYDPYEKQRDFHSAGIRHRERLFMAGNQLGKTTAGAMEAALHATGLYPDWWQGRRFERPTVGWVAGITAETTRDTVQRLLLGRPRGENLGVIPDRLIEKVSNSYTIAGVTDTIMVRHASGGLSVLAFKSYEKGRAKWQGESLDYVWFDEEPPQDVYSEGLTRISATGGLVFMTFTPLLGMSEVVRRFLSESSPDRGVTQMTIDDALHIAEGERARIIQGYPPHEREARAMGLPQLGSGRIFPVAESAIAVDSFAIPRHWPLIGGLDFGWDHPTAAVRLAIDREADCIYVTHSYRQVEATPMVHAAVLQSWGAGLDWAWPADGLAHDKGSGVRLAELYRAQGLALVSGHATFEDGSMGVEAGLLEMLERMQSGRWKVFRHLTDWFEEFRLYHRRDGKVVKREDDLLAASRYAMMMRRFASCGTPSGWNTPIKYDSRWIV